MLKIAPDPLQRYTAIVWGSETKKRSVYLNIACGHLCSGASTRDDKGRFDLSRCCACQPDSEWCSICCVSKAV